MILLYLLACGTTPDPVARSLAPWSQQGAALADECAQEPFEELAITCRVQAASELGRAGQADKARETCQQVPEGTWRDECYFRAGEELGGAGHTAQALRCCAQAGWFGRNCLTHAGWHLPPDPSLHPSTPPAQVEQVGHELLSQVDQALAGAGDGLEGEGRDIVMARFGYNLYVGSGDATPAPAHLADPLGAALRTGFAVEAARLLDAPSVEAIVAIWRGDAPPPSGAPLPTSTRMGRYSLPVLSPHEQGIPHLPTYGGGLRLVGSTPDEDAVIAALEGMFWREDTPSEAFIPWLDDPRDRVRWTAARLVRLAGPDQVDLPALLERLAQESPDENVRWHAADGLKHRNWERRPQR